MDEVNSRNNKRKILIVNSNQFGYHTIYYHFAESLNKNYNVHYICYDRKKKRIGLPDIHIIYLPFPRYRIFRSVYFLIKSLSYANKNNFDFVFTCFFNLALFIGLLSKSKKNILDIRSGSLAQNFLLRKVSNFNIFLASKTFDEVTVISEGLAETLNLQSYSLLPVGSEIYFRGKHSFETLKLLYVGSLNRRDIYETIEGLHIFLLKHRNAEITYDIIGFGDDQVVAHLKDVIKKYNLNDVVIFHGRKTKAELKYFFQTCNVGVSYIPITPWFNNQPSTKTFEYILSGMVCLGTSTSENKKYINSINGFLCKDNPMAFAETLTMVWEKRNTFNSEKIRGTLSKYTWQNVFREKLQPLLS